tara:strand:- start:6886 stop:7098 length:213 start_codon:yes stop_codon:yes gene_type:complete
MKTNYTYGSIELEIDYDIYEFVPATHYNPSEGGYIEIDDILHKGESIFELFSVDALLEIGEDIYEDLKNN